MVVNSMSYATYDSYKESGVDWLGAIPSDWDLQPAFKYIKENKTKNTGLLENTVLSLSYGKIIIKPEEKLTGLVPESFETYQIVEPNDIIIRCTDLQNDKVSLRTGLVENRGIITSAYLGLKVFQNYNSKFLHYYLHSLDITKAIYKFGTGLRQNLSFLDFKRLPLVDISLDLQQKIANFLDQKTGQIDQAIALKQQQIEKLNEYKQIVIQNAVTKGLDPNAPMKNSGVEWIGNIPEHWDVKKLKYLTSKIGSGITPSGGATTYVDKGIPLLRSQNIHFDGLVLDNVANISLNVHKSMKNSQVKQHDVLLNITGGSLGRCCYNSSNDEMNVNQHVCIVRPNNLIKGEFLNGLMSSEVGQKQIWFFQQGGGREGLNFQNLKNFDFPLPSIDEQKEIIAHIESLKQHFKKSVDNYQTQIHRLKEYKNILINQAVTGKIKI